MPSMTVCSLFGPAMCDGQATTAGLSGVVDAQLGRPLDKTQQCSAWHLRPLSTEQVCAAASPWPAGKSLPGAA